MYNTGDPQFRSQNRLPERDEILRFTPEEAGRLALRFFKAYKGAFIPGDVLGHISDSAYGRDSEVERVLFEGVAFLERYGFIVEEIRSYSGTGRGRHLSRMGLEAVSSAASMETMIMSTRDLRALLHPEIVAKALPDFDRGPDHFETAVFNAFKRVEVAVRSACGFGDEMIGVKLMNRAFGEGGILRDPDADSGEQEGLRSLFVGAIGVYKNPASHRDLGLRAADRAIHALTLASELLTIIEQRVAHMSPETHNS